MIAVEQATVYRAGNRRYLTRSGAILGHARTQFFAKHPCECEQPDYASGYPGMTCDVHDAWERVKPRYLRWIRRCLRKVSR